jgi:MFS family permease
MSDPAHKISIVPLIIISIIIMIDMAGYGVIAPLIPDFVKMMDLSNFQVSSLYFIYGLVMLILPVPVGLFADRMDRRKLLYVGLFGKAIALVCFPFADSYSELITVRAFDAIAGTVTWTVALALIADIYPIKSIGTKYGIAMAASELGAIIGPLTSGPLVDKTGLISTPFFLMAAVCVLGGIFIVFLPKHKVVPSSRGVFREIRALASSRLLLLIAALYILGASFIGMMESLYPVYLGEFLSRTWIGIIFGLIGGAVFLFMPVFGWASEKISPRYLISAGMIVGALSSPGLVFFETKVVLSVIVIFTGAGWALFFAPIFPLLIKGVEEKGGQYGLAFGVTNMLWASGFVIGPFFGGSLSQFFGIKTPFIAFSILILIMAPLVFLRTKE